MQLTALLLALLLASAAPAWAQLSRVDGTALSSGGTPSVSSCGSSPSLASGSADDAGQINVGTGVVLTCQLNWSATLVTAPFCMVGTNLSTLTVGWTTDITKLNVNRVTDDWRRQNLLSLPRRPVN